MIRRVGVSEGGFLGLGGQWGGCTEWVVAKDNRDVVLVDVANL